MLILKDNLTGTSFYFIGIRRRTRTTEWRLEQVNTTEQKVTWWSCSTQKSTGAEGTQYTCKEYGFYDPHPLYRDGQIEVKNFSHWVDLSIIFWFEYIRLL